MRSVEKCPVCLTEVAIYKKFVDGNGWNNFFCPHGSSTEETCIMSDRNILAAVPTCKGCKYYDNYRTCYGGKEPASCSGVGCSWWNSLCLSCTLMWQECTRNPFGMKQPVRECENYKENKKKYCVNYIEEEKKEEETREQVKNSTESKLSRVPPGTIETNVDDENSILLRRIGRLQHSFDSRLFLSPFQRHELDCTVLKLKKIIAILQANNCTDLEIDFRTAADALMTALYNLDTYELGEENKGR